MSYNDKEFELLQKTASELYDLEARLKQASLVISMIRIQAEKLSKLSLDITNIHGEIQKKLEADCKKNNGSEEPKEFIPECRCEGNCTCGI